LHGARRESADSSLSGPGADQLCQGNQLVVNVYSLGNAKGDFDGPVRGGEGEATAQPAEFRPTHQAAFFLSATPFEAIRTRVRGKREWREGEWQQ
jgi:hypothetical protein